MRIRRSCCSEGGQIEKKIEVFSFEPKGVEVINNNCDRCCSSRRHHIFTPESMMKLANVFAFRIQIRIRQKNEKNMKVQHFFCFGQNGQQTKFLVLTEFPFNEDLHRVRVRPYRFTWDLTQNAMFMCAYLPGTRSANIW